jgi:hypothetical protein
VGNAPLLDIGSPRSDPRSGLSFLLLHSLPPLRCVQRQGLYYTRFLLSHLEDKAPFAPRAATFRRLKGVRFSLCIRPLRGVYCARSHNRRLFALRGQGPTDTSAACALLPWAARAQPHPSRTAHQGTISACGCVFYANPRPSCKLLEITRGTLPIFSSYIVKRAADRRARNTIRRPMRLTGIPPMFCAWRMYAHGLRTGRAIGQPAF